SAGAGAATPRLRSFSARGSVTGSPSTTLTYSPYRSPVAASAASGRGGGGGRVSARTIAVGDGTTPRSKAIQKGEAQQKAQQKLDFGSTPRAVRQRASAAVGSSGGGGGGGKAIRAARLGTADAAGAASAGAGAREAAPCSPADAEDVTAAAPPVWVTRYVDYSSKYGLGFLLSDGSAGVYFNDATKIALEPAGVAFEYIERTRRSSPASGSSSSSSSSSSGGGGGGTGVASPGDQPPRTRYTLDDFPPELQKKVTLLNHFRGYLHELVKKGE
ncbi:unnamed protein product, partial [Hapterophycus canaliculatus]